jgi:hypothetical protein
METQGLCLMVVNDETPSPDSSSQKHSRRLRIIGVIVLLLGMGSARLVYWLGTRSPDIMNDLSMVGYNRAQSQQMGVLFGKMGVMIDDFLNALKRPGVQATLIVVAATLIALGCFYFARLMDNDDKPR